MTSRWYSVAIVAVLSMSQALASLGASLGALPVGSTREELEPLCHEIKRLIEQNMAQVDREFRAKVDVQQMIVRANRKQAKEDIKKAVFFVYDKSKQVYGHLKSHWKEYTIAGLIGGISYLVYRNVQLVDQHRQEMARREIERDRLQAVYVETREAGSTAYRQQLQGENQQLRGQVLDLQNAPLTARVQVLETQNGELRNDNGWLDHQVRTLQTERGTLRNQIGTLQVQLAERIQQVTELTQLTTELGVAQRISIGQADYNDIMTRRHDFQLAEQ